MGVRPLHFPLIRTSPRGSALVAILICVVIIMGIMLAGPMSVEDDAPGHSRPQMVRDIDRGKDVACGANRAALRTEIAMLQMDNARLTSSDSSVQQLMARTHCPSGGLYVFDLDGAIRCTRHDPPSLPMLIAMVQTPPPTPEQLALKPEPSALIAAEKPAG